MLNTEKKEEARLAWAQAIKEDGGQREGGPAGQLADAVSFTNVEKRVLLCLWRASITDIH